MLPQRLGNQVGKETGRFISHRSNKVYLLKWRQEGARSFPRNKPGKFPRKSSDSISSKLVWLLSVSCVIIF